MSILNLGMQSIGLMRVKMSEECENIISTYNNIEDIHEKAKELSQLENELLESLQPTIELLSSIFERQSLKEENLNILKKKTNLLIFKDQFSGIFYTLL